MRLGSSGGIGVAPGTVVLTTEGLSGTMEPEYSLPILGKQVSRPAKTDPEVVAAIEAVARDTVDYDVVPGKTMAANCFYEGQGRLDGAICDYTEADKMAFLQELSDRGVRNIEMEAAQFASFTHHLGIPAAVCCVTLLDRLQGDQVDTPLEIMLEWDARPGDVVIEFIKSRLGQ